VGTQSHVLQRNVLRGGTSVFGGKFLVCQPAQQTSAYMHCHNLLLEADAKAHQKPELEIYADDVKCSHGAVTGGMVPEQVEYLRMRGMSDQAARALLTEAFIANWYDAVEPELKATVA
jgi:Fe-S cluster assembly protein SufD